jgi:DNA-binding FadR family transcriptional regulator
MMGNSSKPRKKYKPRPTLVNPLGYVLESMTRVADHSFDLVALRILNSAAMVSLLRGTATKQDMDKLVAMSNIVEALYQMGFGAEYKDVSIEGRVSILSIVERAVKHGRFTPTGQEITALNALMELHDAQMDVITVKDMERAVQYVRNKMRSKDRITLPAVPDNLR